MGIRMTIGGNRPGDTHENHHYTEGYNAGYNNAMHEMRRSRDTYDDVEDRRGRRSRSAYDEVEDRRRRSRGEYDESHMPMDDVHWPLENRRIGFGTHGDDDIESRRGRRSRSTYEMNDDMNMLMDMVHDLKKGQEHLKHGMVDSMKKLDPRMASLLETATGVLENPPSTWGAYMKRGDFLGIAKMEGKELLSALEAHKPIKDIRKELSHTLAALMQLASQ